MALTAGTRLGAYEITGSIGAGGMGEVYRARDTRLDRTAAIKVLPELFGTDPDRLARFEREARTLAALNHPNVAQIFGIVDLRSEDGRHAIAMEFVDGEDLSQRLQRGALPVDEAIAVATQVADALEAAHEQGSAVPERLRESSREEYAGSWTANGNLLVFTRIEPSGPDIWVAEVDGEREARPFLATRFAENHPRFSPDGRWIAYQSDESGRFEVYVRPFPGPGQKWLVSNGGGTEPRWRGDGREIFYRSRDAVLATDVTLAPRFTAGEPRVLFKGPFEEDGFWPMWDALPDGQAFLMIQDFSQPRTAVMVVQNWFEELRRRP